MHIRRISVAKYPYPIRIRSNKEITIRILSVFVRIVDIRKISICGYISAHLCSLITKKVRKDCKSARR